MQARGTDADSHSVHLKAFVVQLFQHSFKFKVTILMVKRVEVPLKSLFRSLREVAEITIFTGYFHFSIMARIRKLSKFYCFSGHFF